jgi:hypothetical protein
MNPTTEQAIDYLVGIGCAVETSGGRFSVAFEGEVILRQGNRRDFWLLSAGVSLGEIAIKRKQAAEMESAVDRALNASAVHQSEMRLRK